MGGGALLVPFGELGQVVFLHGARDEAHAALLHPDGVRKRWELGANGADRVFIHCAILTR